MRFIIKVKGNAILCLFTFGDSEFSRMFNFHGNKALYSIYRVLTSFSSVVQEILGWAVFLFNHMISDWCSKVLIQKLVYHMVKQQYIVKMAMTTLVPRTYLQFYSIVLQYEDSNTKREPLYYEYQDLF